VVQTTGRPRPGQAVTLTLIRSIELPWHQSGGFDHGDVHLHDGSVFLAHTATGAVEVIDGDRGIHRATIPGCPEASGVLCVQEEATVYAAARGAGKILMLQAASGDVIQEVMVGPKPNGLAWDSRRKHLLVTDVEDFRARLVAPRSGGYIIAGSELPGRPRWCVYEQTGDRFLVNIRDPACVVCLAAQSLKELGRWFVSSTGPHGLDLDPQHGRAFIACDGGVVSVLSLLTGGEVASVEIAGEPDVIWHNPNRQILYVAIGRPGVIDVIDTATLRRVEQVVTEDGAHTTAFDRVRQRLYVFLPRSCRAALYNEA
jgi:DNA-binding beta-propeller fold protein YncE